jgi:hypothetical protein
MHLQAPSSGYLNKCKHLVTNDDIIQRYNLEYSKWKGFERKSSCPKFMYSSGIYWVRLEEAEKNLKEGSESLGPLLNLELENKRRKR